MQFISRFSQTSDIPPVRLVEFGAEQSKESAVPVVMPAVVNLRSQRIEQCLVLKYLITNTQLGTPYLVLINDRPFISLDLESL
ncbi:hypothetical protein [Acaryochloris sp. CCMEE 5410]|uniref:hypothetical protein n=1 Tax=Acaryochloris sp. CCMEE 5410 TaxID=310037 RepID=UPI001112BD73|nr:hypothetical protein [Acaryochloris sp. CCMEE 5410]KAI9129970.1 hypothetical protein ON05_030385 [Acaryochloris sp. CCMEE 5410]